MTVIKRYPNRKLYDTEAKQYITLDAIAEMIRNGQEIQVIDHASGEDLTAVTLTQIIFEQEKKQSGFLPNSILTNLIQAGGQRFNSLKGTLSSPMNFWHEIDDEINKRIQGLVRNGDLTEGQGHDLLKQLIEQGAHLREEALHSVGRVTEQDLQKLLTAREIPTRSDLQELMAQVEELSRRLDDLTDSTSPVPHDP
jgi:polyhydroxyalkanoate synthesis repressor PhaR